MERHEVERLLKRRAVLLSQPYSADVVDAWYELLERVELGRAWRGLHDLVRDGAAKVNVGDLCRVTTDRKPTTQTYTGEDLRPYGIDDPRHPDWREDGCECFHDRGVHSLCTLHQERAARWAKVIAGERAARGR